MKSKNNIINQIEDALEAASGYACGPLSADRRGLQILCEQAQGGVPIIRALISDAERYQFLRMNWGSWTGNDWFGTPEQVAGKLDAAIDAALLAAPTLNQTEPGKS